MKRIAHNTPEIPAACSGCYRQQLDDDHVDFQVVHDGGSFTVGDSEDVLQRVVTPVDDLILCRTCLKDAARLVGLGEVDEVKAQLEQALAERDAAVQQAAQSQAFAEQIQVALALKPAEEPAPTPKPRTRKSKESA